MILLYIQGDGEGSWTDLTRADKLPNLTLNQRVVGSSPTAPTKNSLGIEG